MNRKIKNIAIIQFPLNDIGGLVTWNKQIQKGFKNIGINTMLLHAVPANRFTVDPDNDVKKDRFTQLAGYHLNYNDKGIKEAIEILNSFDAIIFSKGSPHPTQDNLNKPGIENWPLLYSEVRVPKVMIFHDINWDKTNGWLAEVADHVDICIAAQRKFLDSVKRYPAKCLKYNDYFPIDFENIDKLNLDKNNDQFGIVPTQWTKKKNHHKFIPLLPAIKIPIHLYGSGIEWHYINKTEAYKKAINQDSKQNIILNNEAIHRMQGHVDYHDLQKALAKAFLSIDLSNSGITNYTHFEPLAYRTLSFIERTTYNDPSSVLPQDCAVCYDLDNIVEDINKYKGIVNSKEINKIRNNGQKFIRNFDCTFIAQRIIDNIEKL